jgi:hypothetical protein
LKRGIPFGGLLGVLLSHSKYQIHIATIAILLQSPYQTSRTIGLTGVPSGFGA